MTEMLTRATCGHSFAVQIGIGSDDEVADQAGYAWQPRLKAVQQVHERSCPLSDLNA